MNKNLYLFFVFTVLFLAVSAGCSRSNQVEISGTITVEGVPVSDGSISFSAVDGSSPVEGAVIKNGVYRAKVTFGEKIVKVTGTKNVPAEVYDEVSQKTYSTEDPIPVTASQYSTNDSPLRITAQKNGEVHDFDIPPNEKIKEKE
jgi:phage tail sheath gpL-like